MLCVEVFLVSCECYVTAGEVVWDLCEGGGVSVRGREGSCHMEEVQGWGN